MNLFAEVDDQKTYEKAKAFLNRNVPKLKRYAQVTLSSPQFDGIGGSTYGNHQEEKMALAVEASRELDLIKLAINGCSRNSATILINAYFSAHGSYEAKQALKYQNSRFYELKRQAYIDFADAYHAASGVDLHVYE